MDGGASLNLKGYLNKGPFPQDGGISVSMKVKIKNFVLCKKKEAPRPGIEPGSSA